MSARALPVERSRSCRTRAPRHGCQPCLREGCPRAASRRHYPRVRVALVGDTHSSRAVRPTGACRAPATNAACIGGFEFEATMARPPPCFLTGQGGAYSRSARTGGSPPSPGLGSDGWTAAPSGLAGESLRGSRAESQPHAPRACTPPGQGEEILSARRAGQTGGRAGSGKTIPSGRSPPDPPSERPTPYPGSEHGWFTGQSGDPLGGGPSHDCPVGPGMAVASHSGAE